MKKLYKLKSWFSLPDAAERLSTGLGEQVSVNDILQLVVEGLLPLSWYIRHVPARKVVPYTALVGKGYSPEFFLLHSKLFPGENLSQDELIKSLEWECVDEKESIVYLEGPFRLELKYCGALMDWIFAHLTNTGGNLVSLDGFFVSDEKGNIWQIMEYQSCHTQTPDETENEELAPFYYPSDTFPEGAEFIVQRQDIEAFENSLTEASKTESTTLSKRLENSYLNIIAALLDVIKEGIPSAQNSSNRIGPAAECTSEAQLIAAIAHHYRGIDGLSKRNLEVKLPAAKHNLSTSF